MWGCVLVELDWTCWGMREVEVGRTAWWAWSTCRCVHVALRLTSTKGASSAHYG